MKAKFLFLMLMVSFWPIRANELSGGGHSVGVMPTPERLESAGAGEVVG